MGDAFTAFLLVLVFLAILTRETFVIALLYLFMGAVLGGRMWSGSVINRVRFSRQFDNKAFPGETVPVEVNITNQSWLPAIWLRVQDFFPLEIADTRSFHQVLSLGPHETSTLTYNLKAQKRGFYTVGPINISSGDMLGLSPEKTSEGQSDHLTVYPRVVPFSEVHLPSRSPMGSLRTRQPVFEDPTRPAGKRDYQAGDSLRRIDWKASASTGRLQTKLFEPSISLETVIFLNLNTEDYPLRARYEATELAIVIAASLANWIVAQRQAVGLYTNAVDPLTVDNRAIPLPARKGRPHLMRILELMARLRALETHSFQTLINQQRVHLNWGTTLIILTSGASQALFDELLQARRSGLLPVLILCGENHEHRNALQMSKLYHIPATEFRDEKDLDLWRK
jgi:uncharacterized protein (DUF58 family)